MMLKLSLANIKFAGDILFLKSGILSRQNKNDNEN